MIILNDHIIADEGKVFRRIADNVLFGNEIHLGYTYYINKVKLEEPLLELPEHFEEVEEIITDDKRRTNTIP